MKVKMRTLASGPEGVLQAGKVYNLSEEQAKALVEGGYAEKVDEKTPALVVVKPVQRPVAKTGGGRREKATESAAESAVDD